MEEKKRKAYAYLYENSAEGAPEKKKEAQPPKRTGKKKHRSVERLCRLLAFVCLVTAIVFLAVFNYYELREAKREAVLEYIRQEKAQLEKQAEDTESIEDALSDLEILPQYDILYKMYPDLVGWIKVDGTQIDYPVMQDRTGEEYYLTHNFEGKEDNEGAPFVASDVSIDPLDQNIVIFGHNVRTGTQFGELDKYLDESFYEEHPTIVFDTIYETGTYQIVAVVKTHVKTEDEEGFRYYWFRSYENRSEFQELFDFVEENRLYDTGEYLSYGDTTLMLSTCEYTVDNGRLVVIAKRI